MLIFNEVENGIFNNFCQRAISKFFAEKFLCKSIIFLYRAKLKAATKMCFIKIGVLQEAVF